MAAQDSEIVRRFMRDYSDRILFGTDVVMRKRLAEMPADEREGTVRGLQSTYRAYFNYFERDEPLTIRGRPARGLCLPDGVLRRIYFENGRAWYPGI